MLRRELFKGMTALLPTWFAKSSSTSMTEWDRLRADTRNRVIESIKEDPCQLTVAEIDQCFESAADNIHELTKSWRHKTRHPGFLTSGLVPPQMAIYKMTMSYVCLALMRKELRLLCIYNLACEEFRKEATETLRRYLEDYK